MTVYLKHGPCDGQRRKMNLPAETILITSKHRDVSHFYRLTTRQTPQGDKIYQYMGYSVAPEELVQAS